MKNYSDIAFKYLKKQKKRSFLTILGIILSVALITSILTMFYSLNECFLKDIKKTYGNFEFAYTKGNINLYDKLKHNPKVDKTAVTICLEDSTPLNKDVSIYLSGFNKEAFEIIPSNIQKGNKPKNGNEICIEEWALNKLEKKVKINDYIKLKVNGKYKKYKLVGILQNNDFSQQKGISNALTFIKDLKPKKKFTIYVKLKDKISPRKNLNEFKSKTIKENFKTNDKLLIIKGQGDPKYNTILYTELGILIGIIVIATVAVIYNAFNISILEKVKQFGVLRSLGATPKQIKNIVFKESFILSLIGIPIGIISGILGLKIVLYLISKGDTDLITANQVVTTPYIILACASLGLLSIFISAFIPTRKASKISPLDAIYNRGSLCKEKINKNKSLISKFLPIEYSMAYKNITRNKKRFRITTFSICISIVIYMIFSTFSNLFFTFNGKGNESLNMSYIIFKENYKNTKPFNEKDYNKLSKIKGIDKVYRIYTPLVNNALIKSNKITKEYIDAGKNTKIQKNKESFNEIKAIIQACDEEELKECKKYFKKGSIDKLKDNGVLVFLTSKLYSEKYKKYCVLNVADLKIGDELYIDLNNSLNSQKKYPKNDLKLKVSGILERAPFGKEKNQEYIQIIVTKKFADSIVNKIDLNKYNMYNKKILQEKLENIKIEGFQLKFDKNTDRNKIKTKFNQMSKKDPSIKFIDIEGQAAESKKAKLQMNIFIYGFIAVIAFIGSLNIINTISTNMILRKNEFGMLKSIGMNSKQIKIMVIWEGLFYALVGSFYGIIISLPLSYWMFNSMKNIQRLYWKIPWNQIFIALFFALIIGLISSLIPLKRINKDTIIDNIKMEE